MDTLKTLRLTLEPLAVSHADAMFEVLRDPALYRHLDSKPHATVAYTREVYARLATRTSPDGTERWLNWIVVPHGAGPVGFVQATIRVAGTAWIAYLLAPHAQRRGYASEAVMAMKADLTDHHGIDRFLATVEPDNEASVALLERCGLRIARATEAAGHRLDPRDILYIG